MHELALVRASVTSVYIFLPQEIDRPSRSAGRAGHQGDPTRHGATKPPCFFRPTDRLCLVPAHPPLRSRSPWRPSPPAVDQRPVGLGGSDSSFFSPSPFCPHRTSVCLYLPGFPTTNETIIVEEDHKGANGPPGLPGPVEWRPGAPCLWGTRECDCWIPGPR